MITTKTCFGQTDLHEFSKEPEWVCEDCALERGAEMPENHLATFHEGKCGICEEIKIVTEPRDYGVNRNLLVI